MVEIDKNIMGVYYVEHRMYMCIFQILPFFVMDVLNVPSIPGLFIACLFSAALRLVTYAQLGYDTDLGIHDSFMSLYVC